MAFGSIEIRGMTTAIVAADIMVKAADIVVEKIEHTQKGGYVSVYVTGSTGAVQSAVEAAREQLNVSVLGCIIIPNPDDSVVEHVCEAVEKVKKTVHSSTKKTAQAKKNIKKHCKKAKKRTSSAKSKQEQKLNTDVEPPIEPEHVPEKKSSAASNSSVEVKEKSSENVQLTLQETPQTKSKNVPPKPDCDFLCDLCDHENCSERQ